MEADKRPAGAEDLERVEMGNSGDRQGRVKLPRRTIHFASGETMEEYSTDEEKEEEPVEKKVVTVDASNLTWGPYLWFHLWRMATSTISVCDYMGEKLASLFGITAPKYQYAIDEYYRLKKEQEEEEEENRLADEAERQFTEQQRSDKKDSGLPTREQPERLGASFLNASFDHKPEAPLHTPDNRPPCPLPT